MCMSEPWAGKPANLQPLPLLHCVLDKPNSLSDAQFSHMCRDGSNGVISGVPGVADDGKAVWCNGQECLL